jgi:hypothetical protein
MGLDAAVYRNSKHLKLGPDEREAQLDRETGEVYFENAELSRKYRSELRAAHHRLGNIDAISFLRSEVSRLLGPESLLIQKVLYSGTHCGDIISLDSIAPLWVELAGIESAANQSTCLRDFVAAMQELIRAAADESNPIVFV